LIDRDPWVEIGRRLGRRAGLDFLRRLDATENGTLMLCARKHRGRVEEKWIDPAERIDDREEGGAQSRP
jgi:hypothetical protein